MVSSKSHTPSTDRSRLAELIAVALVMLLAALLRLGHLDLVEFKGDEVQHLHLAERVLDGHLALTGSMASVGLPKPPGMTYLMAIPLTASRDPRVVSGFIALLNVGAVFVCYRIGRRYFGVSAGLIAVLLYAVNPWAVVYARKIFTADVLPPFVALALDALLSALVENRRRAWTWTLVWMTALTQITFSAIVLVPAFAFIVLLYRRRVHWRSLLIGLAIMALSFAPYIYAGLTQGFLRIWEGMPFGSGDESSFYWGNALIYALQLASGAGLHALAGQSFERFLAQRLAGNGLDLVVQGIFASAMLYLTWRAISGSKRETARTRIPCVALALWIWVPLLFDSLPLIDLYHHYLVILYPAVFLAMGIAVADLIGRLPLLAKWVTMLGLLGLAVWQVYDVLFLYAFVDHHITGGGYGRPVHYYITAARRLEALARTYDPPQALIVSDGDDTRWDQDPAVLNYLLENRLPVRFVNGRESMVFPQAGDDGALLITPGAGDTALGVAGSYGREVESLRLPMREEEGSFRFFDWPGGDPTALLDLGFTPSGTSRWTNGVEFLGARLEDPIAPETIRWATMWRISASPPPGVNHHWFNHLVNAKGRKVGQRDDVGFPTHNWRAGDTVLTWFDIPIAPETQAGSYTMRIGMYTYPDIRNVSLMDIAGNAAGEYISLGPIPVATLVHKEAKP